MRLLNPLVLFVFAAPAAFAQAPEAKANPLPITRVALYKNGVGFFEHSGRVTGDQSVTIDFTSAQLNDVLQSLTAIDLNGGRISGAGYNSTTPLEQQLQTLPLALTADPSDVDFYNAIRGARVQVTAAGASITGRLLSIDLRTGGKKSNDDSATDKDDHRFITVVSDTGAVRTLELTSAVSVTLLDTALHTDVKRYLELLASTRNQGLRHLTLLDRGTGQRDLKVSYISEVPVWKSTYRILFTDSKTANAATIQGWSVVDNTTGTDWLNVHLDLIAGAPQSFIQPLSTPYYTRRPEVPLPAEAQLTPQMHDSGEEDKADRFRNGGLDALSEATELATLQPGVSSLKARASGPVAGAIRLGSGSANGVMGGVAGGYGAPAPMMAAPPAPSPESYQNFAAASLAPQTTTNSFDDYFQYTLTDPITIRKNESALVPILQTRVPIERVTLWSQQEPVALRALWITNSSDLTLDRGSFSIVENGSFGGEGLLDPIHPNEKRLLSYAADQAVRVTISGNKSTRKVNHIRIAKGVLTETSIDIAELTYDVRNAAPDARTIIIEHPVRQGWTLDSEPKPAETTPNAYRFRIAAKASETVHLHVGERHTNSQTIRLANFAEDQLILRLRGARASDASIAALQPIFNAHSAVQALDEQLRTRQAEIGNITKDQERLRENMKALKGSPEEKALLSRYTGELNSQEDRLAALNKEIAGLQVQRAGAQADYDSKLNALTLEESV